MSTATIATGRTTMLRASTWSIAKRGILRFLRTPQLIVLGTIQGAMFLLIFRYVFGGAIGAGGLRYVDFLVPGFVTTGVLFTGMGAATAIAEDLEQGFVDRLRSLPIPRSSVLTGRALADTAMHTWSLAITVAIGFAVGFRLHGSVPDALAAFGLLLVFALTFVSSAYVPVDTMPGWLQGFAAHQPLTYMVDAVRSLTQGPAAQTVLGHGAGFYVLRSVLWAAVIVAVFAPLAVARYRRG